MGVVYQALDRERQANVALKTLKKLDGEALLRLKNEFRALQDLEHPNLVSLGELIEESGQWFFTMELVPGVDFMSWVCGGEVSGAATLDAGQVGAEEAPGATVGRFDEARLRAGLLQLARGLHALHAAHKVHRDIKPSNILVTPEGRVVLLDFGLVVDADRRGRETLLVGTVDYMAPEQAAQQPVGPEADWYSVGVLLYQALTGRLPFRGVPLQILLEKQRQEPPAPHAVATGIPIDLDELCTRLLHFDPRRRPSGAEILERLGARRESQRSELPSFSGSSFVGRVAEMATLRRAFEEVRAGASLTVLVRGESGVGKSALVRRFVEGDELSSAVVLAGRCYERESVPYKAVDGVIDALSEHLTGIDRGSLAALLPDGAALLAQVFPVMRRVEAIAQAPRPDALDPKELRSRVFAALRTLLSRLAGAQPLVLVVDDLQWADADSLRLLSEVMHPPDAPPLLLLATVRSDAPPLELSGEVRELALHELPPEEAHRLAVLILAGLAGDADRAGAIAREAGGHPLFIDELVRHSLGGGAGAARLDDALGERIGRLDGEVRRLLELLAVAGTPLQQETAARAAELTPAELNRHAGFLRVSRLVRTGGARGTDPIETYHDRVRQAMLARLDDEARRRCHERLALALEAEMQPEPGALAVHWRGAGDWPRAAAHAVTAAAQAVEALAFDRAARLYRTALELLPEGSNLRDLRMALADALANAGRGAEAAEAYLAAVAHAPEGEALELRRMAADQFLRAGHIDEGLTALESVLGAAGMHLAPTPRRALASLLLSRARLRLRGLRFRERDSSHLAPRALLRIDVCWSVATTVGMVDAIRGADFQTRNLLLALRAGEPRRVARALAVEAAYASLSGVPGAPRAKKLLAAAGALARRLDDPHTSAICELATGIACSYVGRWRADREHCERAEKLLRERCTGVMWEVTTAQFFTTWALAYLGEIDYLRRRVDRCLRDAWGRGDLYAATQLCTGQANLAWLGRDDPEGAREVLRESMKRWSNRGFLVQHWTEVLALCQTDLYCGDGKAAHERLLQTWPPLQRSLLLRIQLTRIEALHLRARAALARAQMEPSAREELLASAARDARRIENEGVHYGVPLARLVQAAVMAARGQTEEAAASLATAAAELDGCDMALHAAAARRRHAELIGGDDGHASDWMALQKIKNPARMTALLAPGF
jgi:eukaryotic-like serine/threonine-protein kinase